MNVSLLSKKNKPKTNQIRHPNKTKVFKKSQYRSSRERGPFELTLAPHLSEKKNQKRLGVLVESF